MLHYTELSGKVLHAAEVCAMYVALCVTGGVLCVYTRRETAVGGFGRLTVSLNVSIAYTNLRPFPMGFDDSGLKE